MEKDFHYHIIYSIAKLTEFDDAAVIAYSSQFVDDNNEGLYSIDKEKAFFPEKIKSNGGYYYPIMTQSLSPKSLNTYVQKYVYVPFHFLPGNNGVTIKDKKNKLSTTPNSANARSLLAGALESGNPYQIGISLHTFADTWSHQNFTGLQEDWNSLYPWYNVFKSIVPNIGHAEAGHAPDIISEQWTDYRLGKKIINQKRVLEATEEIYKMLKRKSGRGHKWSDVKKDYKSIINAKDYDERIDDIREFLAENGQGAIPNYSKDKWIDEAVDKSGGKIVLKDDFTETHWYKFHQAAKTNFAYVLDLIKEL